LTASFKPLTFIVAARHRRDGSNPLASFPCTPALRSATLLHPDSYTQRASPSLATYSVAHRDVLHRGRAAELSTTRSAVPRFRRALDSQDRRAGLDLVGQNALAPSGLGAAPQTSRTPSVVLRIGCRSNRPICFARCISRAQRDRVLVHPTSSAMPHQRHLGTCQASTVQPVEP
jgi:hypothetical protein